MNDPFFARQRKFVAAYGAAAMVVLSLINAAIG